MEIERKYRGNPPTAPLMMRYVHEPGKQAITEMALTFPLLSRRERREIQIKAKALARKKAKRG